MTNYLSQSQIKRLVHQRDNKPKQPKYGNHKVIVDGEQFDEIVVKRGNVVKGGLVELEVWEI